MDQTPALSLLQQALRYHATCRSFVQNDLFRLPMQWPAEICPNPLVATMPSEMHVGKVESEALRGILEENGEEEPPRFHAGNLPDYVRNFTLAVDIQYARMKHLATLMTAMEKFFDDSLMPFFRAVEMVLRQWRAAHRAMRLAGGQMMHAASIVPLMEQYATCTAPFRVREASTASTAPLLSVEWSLWFLTNGRYYQPTTPDLGRCATLTTDEQQHMERFRVGLDYLLPNAQKEQQQNAAPLVRVTGPRPRQPPPPPAHRTTTTTHEATHPASTSATAVSGPPSPPAGWCARLNDEAALRACASQLIPLLARATYTKPPIGTQLDEVKDTNIIRTVLYSLATTRVGKPTVTVEALRGLLHSTGDRQKMIPYSLCVHWLQDNEKSLSNEQTAADLDDIFAYVRQIEIWYQYCQKAGVAMTDIPSPPDALDSELRLLEQERCADDAGIFESSTPSVVPELTPGELASIVPFQGRERICRFGDYNDMPDKDVLNEAKSCVDEISPAELGVNLARTKLVRQIASLLRVPKPAPCDVDQIRHMLALHRENELTTRLASLLRDVQLQQQQNGQWVAVLRSLRQAARAPFWIKFPDFQSRVEEELTQVEAKKEQVDEEFLISLCHWCLWSDMWAKNQGGEPTFTPILLQLYGQTPEHFVRHSIFATWPDDTLSTFLREHRTTYDLIMLRDDASMFQQACQRGGELPAARKLANYVPINMLAIVEQASSELITLHCSQFLRAMSTLTKFPKSCHGRLQKCTATLQSPRTWSKQDLATLLLDMWHVWEAYAVAWYAGTRGITSGTATPRLLASTSSFLEDARPTMSTSVMPYPIEPTIAAQLSQQETSMPSVSTTVAIWQPQEVEKKKKKKQTIPTPHHPSEATDETPDKMAFYPPTEEIPPWCARIDECTLRQHTQKWFTLLLYACVDDDDRTAANVLAKYASSAPIAQLRICLHRLCVTTHTERTEGYWKRFDSDANTFESYVQYYETSVGQLARNSVPIGVAASSLWTQYTQRHSMSDIKTDIDKRQYCDGLDVLLDWIRISIVFATCGWPSLPMPRVLNPTIERADWWDRIHVHNLPMDEELFERAALAPLSQSITHEDIHGAPADAADAVFGWYRDLGDVELLEVARILVPRMPESFFLDRLAFLRLQAWLQGTYIIEFLQTKEYLQHLCCYYERSIVAHAMEHMMKNTTQAEIGRSLEESLKAGTSHWPTLVAHIQQTLQQTSNVDLSSLASEIALLDYGLSRWIRDAPPLPRQVFARALPVKAESNSSTAIVSFAQLYGKYIIDGVSDEAIRQYDESFKKLSTGDTSNLALLSGLLNPQNWLLYRVSQTAGRMNAIQTKQHLLPTLNGMAKCCESYCLPNCSDLLRWTAYVEARDRKLTWNELLLIYAHMCEMWTNLQFRFVEFFTIHPSPALAPTATLPSSVPLPTVAASPMVEEPDEEPKSPP